MQKMPEAPPVAPDGGWGWVVVVAAFFLNLLNGGIFSVHGMLYEAFLQTFPELTQTSAAWIISLQAGFCYVAGFSVGPLLSIISCRSITLVGGLMVTGGLAVMAFVQDIPLIYIFFSFIAGAGMGFQCLPSSILLQHYFERHRALAGGISVSGGSAGVFIYPPIFRLLIDNFGWRGALLLLSGFFLNSVPLALLLRPLPTPKKQSENEDSLGLEFKKGQYVRGEGAERLKTASKRSKSDLMHNFKEALDFSVMKMVAPWVTCAFWFLSYCGITAFYTFITVKCSELGFPNTYASILISLYGVLETIGRLFSGIVGNFSCVNRMYIFCGGMFICGVSSAVSGFVHSFPLLITYAAVIGLNIGSFVGLGVTIVVDIVGKARLPKVQGFNFLAGGLGNFVSLPLLALAWQCTGNYNVPFFIVGACQIAASVMLLVYYLIFVKNKTPALEVVTINAESILGASDIVERTVYFAEDGKETLNKMETQGV